MSDRCEVCDRALSGKEDSPDGKRCGWGHTRECYILGYERTLARADRSEAEFCACKALLIAAQKRGERAEAERAEWKDRASEARALALREAAEVAEGFDYSSPEGYALGTRIRALAALPVEPARRQVTDNANALGAPAARSPATPEEER